MTIIEKTFALDHPAGPGHFPGNPIIPGAVLLAEVLRLIAAHLGLALSPCQIKSAKFSHPTRPGDCVAIEFSESAQHDIKFQCRVEATVVLTGVVKCGTPATAI